MILYLFLMCVDNSLRFSVDLNVLLSSTKSFSSLNGCVLKRLNYVSVVSQRCSVINIEVFNHSLILIYSA
jgi:hypothetical protein